MSKKTKIFLGIIIVAIIIGVVIYAMNIEKSGDNEISIVSIGLVGHFSGEYASYGLPMKKAIELAVDEINNKENSDFKVNLIVEDDGADSNKAASAISKLINVDNVNYILSAQGSGASSVVSPIAQNNQRLLMITLGSAPEITSAGEYVFRSVPSDVYQGGVMVEVINNKLRSKKIAGLYVNDAYGEGIKNIINKNKNVQIVASEMFEAGAVDFKTQLLKIKSKNPDALVLVARREEAPLILRQIKELGLEVKIIASETFKDKEIIDNSHGLAEGVFVIYQSDPKDYVDFKDRYLSKYEEEPSAYSMYAYDGAMVLMKSIENSSNKLEKVKEELAEITYDGASGQVGFDSVGDRIGIEYILYIVKNGEFIKY